MTDKSYDINSVFNDFVYQRSSYKKSTLKELPRWQGTTFLRHLFEVLIFYRETYLLYEGVNELTKNEIRKDFRDIEKSMPVDSDSETSVKSNEVLNSTYPVKPRRNPKNMKAAANRPDANIVKDYPALNEEALNFNRAMRFSKKALYDAEEQREKLVSTNSVSLCYFTYYYHNTYSIIFSFHF
jgi:hypothetical protein